MIITIDGPAGTGKSTVAKHLAEKLNFFYFDTGAMYRSFSWFLLSQNIDLDDEEKIQQQLDHFCFDIVQENSEKKYFVNKQDVTLEIRTQEITSIVSKVSAYPFIRSQLVKTQRKFGQSKDAVFEGRDMGTVVFPNADLKIFLTAEAEIRAERRYNEFIHTYPEQRNVVTLNKILGEIQRRDHIDTTRKASPLKKAKDAHLIDTSHLTPEEVVDKIMEMLSKGPPKASLFYRIVRGLAKGFFHTFFKFKIYGIKNLPKGSVIIAPNHVSFLDPPVIASSCPFEVHFLARSTLFKNRAFSWLIKKLNSHPVGNDRATFKVIFKILQNHHKVVIFPEGERSSKGKLKSIKSGIGFISWKSKCPIVPVYISGTYDAWPKNKKWPSFFVKIACVYGSPIYCEDIERDEAIITITQKTHDAINQLQTWFENGAKGDPP